MPDELIHDYVNIDLGNGLVLSENKPLPEPMSIKFFDAIWRHKATISLYHASCNDQHGYLWFAKGYQKASRFSINTNKTSSLAQKCYFDEIFFSDFSGILITACTGTYSRWQRFMSKWPFCVGGQHLIKSTK